MPGPPLALQRTFDVGARFVLPQLRRCVGQNGQVRALAPVSIRTVYFDTADLRLARSGVTLCHRTGAGEPWTVRLPTTVVRRSGTRSAVPGDLVDLLTAYTRGCPVRPTVTLRTSRTRYELVNRHGVTLAEVADDAVSVLDDRQVRARYREIELAGPSDWKESGRKTSGRKTSGRKTSGRMVPDRAAGVLGRAGAAERPTATPLIRALGEAAAIPVIPPPVRLRRGASAGDVVAEVIRADVMAIIGYDPLTRLRARDSVRRMRVAVRRLRCTLRLFGPLVVPEWADRLGLDLRWLAHALGAVREAEMLRARLPETAASDPAAPLDAASLARVDADLAARCEVARLTLDAVLASPRYRALLEALYSAAARPRLTPTARRPARALLPRLIGRAVRRLADGRHGIDGAGDLDEAAPDAQWHAVRVRLRRARYATEAAAPVLGRRATALAGALRDVADVLGAHQDAVVASRAWLAITNADPDDHALAVTAGRLIERERIAARAARDSYPGVWRAARRDRLTAWLP